MALRIWRSLRRTEPLPIGEVLTCNFSNNASWWPAWALSSEEDPKTFLFEMVVVGQDIRNPVATHRRHGDAVHKTIALVIALLIQTQACQKGFPRLRMNRHPRIVQDYTDRASSRLPQMRAALSQAVQKFGQHLVRRDQANFSKRLTSTDHLRAVLIVWVKRRAPVECVREDQLHFFFGAPWR